MSSIICIRWPLHNHVGPMRWHPVVTGPRSSMFEPFASSTNGPEMRKQDTHMIGKCKCIVVGCCA